MNHQNTMSFYGRLAGRWVALAGLLWALPWAVLGSENVPHRPFAYWADLPAQGQFIFGLVYRRVRVVPHLGR